jgi:uncharacterized protein YkwD
MVLTPWQHLFSKRFRTSFWSGYQLVREAVRERLRPLLDGVPRAVLARRSSRRFLIDELEPRLLLSFSPSGLEQEMLELVNRMRLQPAAELASLTTSLGNPARSSEPEIDSALQYFNVSGPTLSAQWATLAAAPPLAWNEALYNSSTGHSQQMIAQDTQAHQLPGELALGNRVSAAGYTGFSLVGENIYAFALSPLQGHAAFAIDWGSTPTGIQNPPGHRQNIMEDAFREVGLSVIPESNAGTAVGSLVITQDFGSRFDQGDPYLLGVVYRDADQDHTYDAGEGLGGVSVHVDGALDFDVSTMAAGGWQVQVPPGTYAVTFSGSGLASASTVPDVTVADGNKKVDLRAAPGGGGVSFTDEPLTGGRTRISAVHVTELRNAVNSLRASRGLVPFSFMDPTLVAGVTPARVIHIAELRQALAPVFTAAGLAPPAYTDPQLTAGKTIIRAAHIQEVRDAVRSAQVGTLAALTRLAESPAMTITSDPLAAPFGLASDREPSSDPEPWHFDAVYGPQATQVSAIQSLVMAMPRDPEDLNLLTTKIDSRPAVDWLPVAAYDRLLMQRMPGHEDWVSDRLSLPVDFLVEWPVVADSLRLTLLSPAEYPSRGISP